MQNTRRAAFGAIFVSGCCLALALSTVTTSARQAPPSPAANTQPATAARAVLDKYCVSCHNQKLHTAGLALDAVDASSPATNPEIWEKVVARLQQGSMPPP